MAIRFQADADLNQLLVSAVLNRRTMHYHFAEFIKKSTSSGVNIVSQQISVHQFVEDILLIWSATEVGNWTNRKQPFQFQ